MKSTPWTLILSAALTGHAWAFTPESTLWLDRPAKLFTESLPLGNGRLGAMDFGGVEHERIALNENTLWSGSVQQADRPDAWKVLPNIRELLLAGKNHEAESLVNHNFTCAGPGTHSGRGANVAYGSYELLGDLQLDFTYPDAAPAQEYQRALDLTTAEGHTEFTRGGVKFTRDIFVSAPDQVVVVRLTADRPGQLNFQATLNRPERFHTESVGNDGLLMTGTMTNGVDGDGVKYAARLQVLASGGKVSAHDSHLTIGGANEALLLITAETDYQRYAKIQRRDVAAAAQNDLASARLKSFAQLQSAHQADYQRYYQRVKLDLPVTGGALAQAPTWKRLQAMDLKNDPSLAALYFNFGRYLFISCSRPGQMAANLQGLWTDTTQPPWSADFHLNVNLQMIYWPAETCNLGELAEPFTTYVESLVGPGEHTAWSYYHAHGWVAHVPANAWGFTAPGESASWGATASDSAWLCQNLWDHWKFSNDRAYLQEIYPILRGAAQFYADMLIEEPTHHWLVTAPANSPENAFVMPDGHPAHICLGPTMDNQLLRFLFGAAAEAAETLGLDADQTAHWRSLRDQLPPTRIGPDGRVMEWLENYPEADPHHRHTSHLWGLYPGNEISPFTTPELAAAARKTLVARGDLSTGWATAFRMGMWARLHDGDHAFKLLQYLVTPADEHHLGGCYANLFDAHPPFQIDGNFGGATAITELLVQSQTGQIELLPALPSAWPDGAVTGLRARGGYEVSLVWSQGKLTTATIRNISATAPVTVHYGNQTKTITLAPGELQKLNARAF